MKTEKNYVIAALTIATLGWSQLGCDVVHPEKIRTSFRRNLRIVGDSRRDIRAGTKVAAHRLRWAV